MFIFVRTSYYVQEGTIDVQAFQDLGSRVSGMLSNRKAAFRINAVVLKLPGRYRLQSGPSAEVQLY